MTAPMRTTTRLPGAPWRRVVVAAALVLLAGCATGPNADPRDPLEPYNRTMTKFNTAVDNAVIKPVARGYTKVVPRLVRTGVSNFFGNLNDFWSLLNNALQGKGYETGQQIGRVLVNSFIGLGGLIDVATQAGIEKYREDFGQTLGSWGVPSGPYLVLPFFGPSTVRDSAGLLVDWQGNAVSYVNDVPWRNSLWGVQALDKRASVLTTEDFLETAALDSYTFTRDAYLQKRQNDVHDGNPPQDSERYDLPAPDEAPPPADGASAPGAPASAASAASIASAASAPTGAASTVSAASAPAAAASAPAAIAASAPASASVPAASAASVPGPAALPASGTTAEQPIGTSLERASGARAD